MKPTTRLRILDFLRKHQTASVGELSRSFGMTKANIRHHLAVLEMNNMIEMISLQREGPGRPVMVYGLSRFVLGDGLDQLSLALMAEWLGDLLMDEREAGLKSLAQRLAGVECGATTNAPMAQRLTLSVDHLNRMHYQARWEASLAGPRLVFGHCPYSAIIERCPELCIMDTYLLEIFLNAQIKQIAKLEIGARGEKFCSFQVAG